MVQVRLPKAKIVAMLVTLAGFLAGTGVANAQSRSRIQWMGTPADAMVRSEKTRRPVLVDVWASWCNPCKVMAVRTYGHPQIIKASERFIPLRVNADADGGFSSKYGANILPTTLVLDHQGHLLTKISGVIGPTDLLEIMKRVLAGYEEYLTHVQHPNEPESQMAVASYLVRIGNTSSAVAVLRRHLKQLQDQTGADPGKLEIVELRLAGSLVADGRSGQAVPILQRLSVSAINTQVKGRALYTLVRAQRARGDILKADRSLQRLQKEFPELAVGLNESR